MLTPRQKAQQIVDECVDNDTDTSYGYALNCDKQYLTDKITEALQEAAKVEIPSSAQLTGAAYDHTTETGGGSHERLVFIDGARWALSRMSKDG